MGNYNPNVPQIVGNEWAPVDIEPFTPKQSSETISSGYRFVLGSAQTLTEGRLYTDGWPPANEALGAFKITVHQADKEDECGPIRRVVIPCNSVGTTGVGGVVATPAEMLAAAASPADGVSGDIYVGSAVRNRAAFFFNTDAYMQLLSGKRILAVNYLYQMRTGYDPVTTSSWTVGMGVYLHNESLPDGVLLASLNSNGVGNLQFTQTSATSEVFRMGLGEVDLSTGGYTGTQDASFWTYDRLRRFEATSGANRTYIEWFSDGTDGSHSANVNIGYSALEVFYCDENRVAVGGRYFLVKGAGNASVTNNTNPVTMRDPQTGSSSVSMAAGNYSVTVGSLDLGHWANTFTISQALAGLRQLYQVPSIKGIQVSQPYPLDETAVNKQISYQETNTMVPVSLHTSSAAFTECHGYIFQVAAQVFGSVTAVQDIADTSIGGTYDYPWARFYARKFGDTRVPLTLTRNSTGATVQVTPQEHDALPEIVDGWKEVTREFSAANSMGAGTNPVYTFSSPNEAQGNRWEILGASSLALSGNSASTATLAQAVPSGQRLGPTTYGGSTINLDWVPGITPMVTATTEDQLADATLIFSQYPPAITGFSLTAVTQPVTGIGANCAGAAPCCIPTGINYNRLTWAMGSVSSFNTPVTGSWGTSDDGRTWTAGTNAAYVRDGTAYNWITAGGGAIQNVIDVGMSDQELYLEMTPLAVTTSVGLSWYHSIMLRWAASDTYYLVDVVCKANNQLFISITRRLPAGFTVLASQINVGLYAPGLPLSIRAQVVGSRIRGKVWNKGEPEPFWQVLATDTNITSGNSAGFRPEGDVAATPSPWTIAVDNFCAYPPGLSEGGTLEIQRRDSITDWQTIMLANPCTWYFNDYEARVGMSSEYRMRSVNSLNFYGQWSPTVTGMFASPGVSGAPCIGTTGGVLIFTSNYNQGGSYNLAYVPTWEGGKPTEEFGFPEAGQVSFGRMYNRDYQVEFKPLERGGETFQRTILVQAAAVSPPRLANMRSLRDMAWADVPYVCVRNDIGDRWFAAVQVPSGRVQKSRTLYFAAVTVTEVTATAYPVSP